MTDPDIERATLGRKENTAVMWMRGLVFLVLFATTVLASTIVYRTTRYDQVQDFEKAFEADATKVLESFNAAIERRLESIDALSVSITASARETKSTFPNVTISDFEVRCANSRILSDTAIIQYHPIVTDATRKGWESYQKEHRDHFMKSLDSETEMIRNQDILFEHDTNRLLQDVPGYNDRIVIPTPNGTFGAAPEGSGPFLPLWQMSPVTPTPYFLNLDMLWSHASRGSYLETMNTGQAVIGAATNLKGENLGESGKFWQLVLSMSQYRYDISEYLGDPLSVVGYPVFDSFDLKKRNVAGIIGTNFYWRLYFRNVLPTNTRGIVCVLENTLKQSFTYRIDDTVSFLGDGDLHDTYYDKYEMSSEIAAHIAKNLSPETKSYTSVELNTAYCNYKLRVYPSKDNEKIYLTNAPIIMTVVIVCVFVFTSLVFVLYTIAVNRRQEVVMNRAVASSAIVSSLFPSHVRDQLYQENATDDTRKGWQRQEGSDETANGLGTDDIPRMARPIAQLYANTTVLFADIVGFTSWSSLREPVHVFELLETLYLAFDAIATRRKVFKVETIGDCYVAVTGVPDPQDDHAVIMVKFAQDCLAKMNQLTAELAVTLGEDTAQLAMRIGLHSGSVTGGVLRGQKSRFQLFGDTMNMGARMESNGIAGRIHVSEATANELVAKGKFSWVTAREDKIFAKGKGELQTYWASASAATVSVVTSVPMSNAAKGSIQPNCDNGGDFLEI